MSKSNFIRLLVFLSSLPASFSSSCLFLEAILSASFFPNLPDVAFFSFMAFTIGFSLSSGSLVRFLKGFGSGTPGKPSRLAKHLSFRGFFLSLFSSRPGAASIL